MRGDKQRIGLTLVDAIVKSLAALGVDVRKETGELRRQERSVRTARIDLTDFYYASAVPNYYNRGWITTALANNHGSQSLFASALCDFSNFVFFADRNGPIKMTLTFRTPSAKPASSVIIHVNGRHLTTISAAERWATVETLIPADCLLDDSNEICIQWPDDALDDTDCLRRAANMLLARRIPRFHRILGEIYSLVVSGAPDSIGVDSGREELVAK